MKYKIDHDIHIHSELSLCSADPEQRKEDILRYAKREGLSTVCVTDHLWDRSVEGASEWYETQTVEHVSRILPLPGDGDVRFLFGCETEMRADMTIGISKERFNEFDFIIIPTTHMHMKEFTVPADAAGKPEALARLWVDNMSFTAAIGFS